MSEAIAILLFQIFAELSSRLSIIPDLSLEAIVLQARVATTARTKLLSGYVSDLLNQ